MNWRRNIDYHGSRAYAADAPDGAGFSQIGITIAWVLAWPKRVFAKLLRVGGTPPPQTILLLQDEDRRAAALGSTMVDRLVTPFPHAGAQIPNPANDSAAVSPR